MARIAMDDLVLARLLHVVAVVLWIGGVGFVTTVLLPGIGAKLPAAERLRFFHEIERRFARQARATTLVAGFSGFYMVWRFDLWGRFVDAAYWWMHAMLLIWLIFTAMLFLAEPLFLDRWLEARAARDPERTFALVRRLHWGLLIASLVTIAGAVAGSHGGL